MNCIQEKVFLTFEQMKEQNRKVSKETVENFSVEFVVSCDLDQLAYSVTIPITHCIGTGTNGTTFTTPNTQGELLE